MEREAEWVSEKSSAAAAEENGGVVDVANTKQNGPRQAGMEQQSVYLVRDEGSLSTDGTFGMKVREVYHSIDSENKIQENGKTEFRTKESNNLENALVSEETSGHSSTNVILENGSSSNLSSKGCNEIGVGRSELEIEEDTRLELVTKSKQEVTEIDLEKVLEEQETHDLYCPNCSSCITKRVILRKRKRIPRETQYKTPPAIVQQLPHLDATIASADEITEMDQNTEPDIFRCLSCFSFFIPTDTGFNIFRFFGRRETENQLASQLSPAKTEITSAPIFKAVGIISGASESGVQFGVESNNYSGKDPSFKEKQSPLTISALGDSGARNIEEGQSTNAEKTADGVNWVSFIPNGKQVADPAGSSMQTYLDKTVSEPPTVGNNQVMTGGDMSGPITIVTSSESTSLISQNINSSLLPGTVVSTHTETQIYLGERRAGEGTRKNWDVLKSIVYGGLIESLTSLSIVSSAAGSDASTLNIVALGLATLIGGFFVIANDLSELRTTQEDAVDKNGEPVGRYWELLGRKANFRLHATVAVLTYMLVGLLPPLIYGFSFRKSDNKEYKLIVVAAASFVCISVLAIGKAHVNARKAYIKSLAYYLTLSFAASGLSYVAGVMIHRFLDQLGLYDNTSVAPAPPPPADIYHGIASTLGAWASS